MLILGDNLDTLPIWVGPESVDLIYLDPPFNSNATYNMLFKHVDGTPAAAQIKAFTDTWQWNEAAEAAYNETLNAGGDAARVLHGFWDLLDGPCNMLAYLSMMTQRLNELHRVLKPTGSIYLHCDPTASHYLKILMDALFGAQNFQNEVIWAYNVGGKGKTRWARKHDDLFFYSKGSAWFFDGQSVGIPRDTGTKSFGGKIGVDEVGRRFQDKLVRTTGKYYRYYLDEPKIPEDWWVDINSIQSGSAERVGYPTQKPIALLERIIKASCPPGGVVLDPFCGCGTTIDAAQKLGVRWIGIDVSRLATDVIEDRLREQHNLRAGDDYDLRVFPPTIEEAERLSTQDRHAFQQWACFRIGATPTGKGADRGIDGVIDGYVQGQRWRALVSVKSGHAVKVSELRDLLGTLEREKAQTGIFVTLANPPKTFVKEVAEAGLGDLRIPRLQALTVAELFAGKRPITPAPAGVAQFDAGEAVSSEAVSSRTRVRATPLRA